MVVTRFQTQARASGEQATGGVLNEMIEIGVLNVQHARDKGGKTPGPDPDMPFGGHYLKVRKDLVLAHAAFRTALITDLLDELGPRIQSADSSP